MQATVNRSMWDWLPSLPAAAGESSPGDESVRGGLSELGTLPAVVGEDFRSSMFSERKKNALSFRDRAF